MRVDPVLETVVTVAGIMDFAGAPTLPAPPCCRGRAPAPLPSAGSGGGGAGAGGRGALDASANGRASCGRIIFC